MSLKLLNLRFPLLLLIALVLVSSLFAGLLRMGLVMPVLLPGAVATHGPLMISGVLGTLISLERAVALSAVLKAQARWAYLTPLLTGLGGLLLAFAAPGSSAQLLITAGSLGLVVIFGVIVRRHPAPYTFIMGLGAVVWFIGNSLWLAGWPVYAVVHCWIAFLVLTIVGERLELARITRLSASGQRWFLLTTALFVSGVGLTLVNRNLGIRLAGGGEIIFALWLWRYDIARHTIRRPGLPRFIAVCLLLGYIWLGIGGAVGLFVGEVTGGFLYDALLHSLLLGFIFSMIFGHAPIIFPALTGQTITFRPSVYSYLALLHLSLALRLAGDFTASLTLRQWGGLLNVTAVLLFMGLTGFFILTKRDAAAPALGASE